MITVKPHTRCVFPIIQHGIHIIKHMHTITTTTVHKKWTLTMSMQKSLKIVGSNKTYKNIEQFEISMLHPCNNINMREV